MNAHPGSGPVVVGIGSGGPAGHALDWAAAEAATRGRPLRIVHALHATPPADAGGVLPPADPLAHDAAAALLRDAEVRARRVASDLAVSTRVAPGDAAGVLLAQARGADLLVLGGRARRRPLLTRPLPARVAARAGCPVAVVPVRGTVGGPLCTAPRVVVGVDGSPAGAAALAHGLAAARRRGVPLVAVHAWTPDPHADVECLPAAPEQTGTAAARLLDDALRPWTAAFPDVAVVGRLVRDDPVHALVTASLGAALLVLGAPGRGRLRGLVPGGTGARVLRHSSCPATVVPADVAGAEPGRSRRRRSGRPDRRSTG